MRLVVPHLVLLAIVVVVVVAPPSPAASIGALDPLVTRDKLVILVADRPRKTLAVRARYQVDFVNRTLDRDEDDNAVNVTTAVGDDEPLYANETTSVDNSANATMVDALPAANDTEAVEVLFATTEMPPSSSTTLQVLPISAEDEETAYVVDDGVHNSTIVTPSSDETTTTTADNATLIDAPIAGGSLPNAHDLYELVTTGRPTLGLEARLAKKDEETAGSADVRDEASYEVEDHDRDDDDDQYTSATALEGSGELSPFYG